MRRLLQRRNSGHIENLTLAMFPYRRAAMTRLRALRSGRSKAIAGVGDVAGHPYVAIGTLAVPLAYAGPEQPDISSKLASMLATVSSEEIFVTYVPCITGHKNRGTWEENVHTSRDGMIDPVLFAMAVYAVGDMPRLYQGPTRLDPIAVIGTLGTAIVAAMRKPEDMPPVPPKEKPASRTRARAPRVAASAPVEAPRAAAPRVESARASTEPGIEIEGAVDLYSVYPAAVMLDELAQSYRDGMAPELTQAAPVSTKKLDAPGPSKNRALYLDSIEHLLREGPVYDNKSSGKDVDYIGTGVLLIPGFNPAVPLDWTSKIGPAGQTPWSGYDLSPRIRNALDYGYLTDMRELTVREIPAPAGWSKKTAKDKERMVFISALGSKYGFDARDLGIAVRAVGPNIRLFQIRSRADSPLFVRGDRGVAIVVPQTPEDAKKALIRRLDKEAAARASATPEAPRPTRTPQARRPARASRAAEQADPDSVWSGHDRVDPYLRIQRYVPSIRPTLNRYISGKDKNLKGWGEYDGSTYISDGHIAIPGYQGPKTEEGGREFSPNKQKHWSGHIDSMAEVMKSVASPQDSRELTVEKIPLPTLWDNKEYPAPARTVLIYEWGQKAALDPKLFGLAVLAVGPNVRLFQSRSSELNAVAVKGDNGVAALMPQYLS